MEPSVSSTTAAAVLASGNPDDRSAASTSSLAIRSDFNAPSRKRRKQRFEVRLLGPGSGLEPSLTSVVRTLPRRRLLKPTLERTIPFGSFPRPGPSRAWRTVRAANRSAVSLAPVIILMLILLPRAMPAAAQEGLLPTPRIAPDKAAQPSPTPAVEPGVRPQEDRAIEQRLRTTFDTIEGLAPVYVQVSSGVVVLSGEVSGQALREQAGRLARNVKGVAEVENRIEVAQDLESRVTPALRRLHEAWLGFVRLLPVLLVALAIMASAVLLGRWLARRQGLYRHLAANAFLAHLLAQVAQGIVLIGGAALAMLLLDASGLVNTLLGAAGILGLALGFALRDTVENYIASILLSLRRPFDAEDYVRIEKHEGFVVRLTSRATVLLTLDGNQIRIPNATVFKGLIVNFTAHPQRRFTFQVGIAPDEQLSRAQQVATDALAEVDGVLTDPPPAALYQDVPDVGVSLTVAGWMDQSTHDFLRVRSEAIRVVVTRMTEANVAAPEATIRVRRAQDGGTKRQEPKPATGTSAPEFPTSRDRSIERVVEQERSRGTDLLDSSKPPE